MTSRPALLLVDAIQMAPDYRAPFAFGWFLLRMVIWCGLGVGLFVLEKKTGYRIMPPPAELRGPILFAAMVPVIFVTILVHELGHVVGAAIAGRRVFVFAVAPILVSFAPTRVLFFPALFRGFVGALPPDGRESPLDAVYFAGGVIANVLAGAAAFAWAEANPGLLASDLANMFGFFSLVMAIANLLPMRLPNGAASDGLTLVRFFRGTLSKGENAASFVAGYASAGVRPRDWPRHLIDEVLATNPVSPMAQMLRLAWLEEHGRFDEARAVCVDLLSRGDVPPPFRAAIRLYAARFAALVDGDAEAARRIMDAVPGRVRVEPYLRQSAQAAVEMAEGKAAAALQSLAKARRRIRFAPVKLGADDHEVLDRIEAMARALIAPPMPSRHAPALTLP